MFSNTAKKLFSKQVVTCSQKDCAIEFGVASHKYQCEACKEYFCHNHAIKRSYFEHIDALVDLVKDGKYLCYSCIESSEKIPNGWQRSFSERKCAHPGCDENLSSISTLKRSCKVCGLWYCNGHSDDAKEIPGKWLTKRTKYLKAETVCCECAPSREKRGVWEDIKSAWHDSNLFDRLTDSYLLFGFRISLLGLSLMVLIGVAPTTYSVFNNEAVTVLQKLWNLFLCGIAAVYLGKEIIIESIKRPRVRPYAVTFCFLAIGYVGYKLLYS